MRIQAECRTLVLAALFLAGLAWHADAQDPEGGGITISSGAATSGVGVGLAKISNGWINSGILETNNNLLIAPSAMPVSTGISSGTLQVNNGSNSVGGITLTSVDTFSGTATLSVGTLQVNSGSTIATAVTVYPTTGSGFDLPGGGTVTFTGPTTSAGAPTLPAGSVISSSGTVMMVNGILTLTGTDNSISINGTTMSDSGTLTYNLSTGAYSSAPSSNSSTTSDSTPILTAELALPPTKLEASFSPVEIPEPSSWAMLLAGVLGLVGFAKRRAQRTAR